MRNIKTDWYQCLAPVKFWYQWHDTQASLLVQVDWHRLLVPENWSVCMALNIPDYRRPYWVVTLAEASLFSCSAAPVGGPYFHLGQRASFLPWTKDVREPASSYYAGLTQDKTPIGLTVKHHGPQDGGVLRFVFTLVAVFGFVVSRGRTF